MQIKPFKQINWMEISGLLVGVLFTVAVMIFGIVLYAKIFSTGMVGIEEYKLHSTFDKALGLRPGTRVQISGVDIGQISNMTIIANGVSMEFTIRKEFQNLSLDGFVGFLRLSGLSVGAVALGSRITESNQALDRFGIGAGLDGDVKGFDVGHFLHRYQFLSSGLGRYPYLVP